MAGKLGFAGVGLVVLGACFGESTGSHSAPAQEGPPPPPSPVTRGDWTYYGTEQGLSGDVQDVSADEGGNVYVAGGDALYVKRLADAAFLRFDSENAGLTENCNDPSEILNPTPPKPFYQCRVLAVAGAAPGKAIIGFEGFGYLPNAYPWAIAAGGADVVTFDAERGTAARERHVLVASPPHVVCGHGEDRAPIGYVCPDPADTWWNWGRRMFRLVRRIVVNHDRSSAMYGDAWLSGEHATFAALLANAEARGLPDRISGWGADWADARGVWEHHHPVIYTSNGWFLNKEAWGLSIDPRTGQIWGSNGFRTAYLAGYGPDLSWDQWGMLPWEPRPEDPVGIDIWPDPDPVTTGDPMRYVGASVDDVRSLSHCADGTLWVGSPAHGLARIAADSHAVTLVPAPEIGDSVYSVACDPADGSIWVGLGGGGVARLREGVFERVDTTGLPAFASQVVQSIQIDRWSSPRVVYFAFSPVTDAAGKIVAPGGVGAYDGP
jgi:hypothetical protein